MIVALSDVVNDNSISGYALSLFGLIITGMVTLIIGLYKARTEVKQARDEASKAKENTTNISNGFASGVDRKLTRIIDAVSRLDETQEATNQAVRKHLEWHLEKESKS